MSSSSPEIALIGGGTGSFTLLQELKNVTPNITAIVNMSDDGGSTGRLREQLGVSPPGDLRQCLVALSELPEMRRLFGHRFGEGDLAGHPVGNIVLSALEMQHGGDIEKAVQVASSMLGIVGDVVPVTLEKHELVMRDGGEVIKGEYEIGHRLVAYRDAHIELDPDAEINPRAGAAIRSADLVVIAPGNMYGSLLPALAVRGMSGAFKASRATKIAITNLINKPGHTDNWHVADHIRELERYVGAGQIDVVLYNDTLPPPELLERYAKADEHPVINEEEGFRSATFRAIGAPLVANEIYPQDACDTMIQRTQIRHNARAVSDELRKLLQ
ncbi:MAG TPA: gluconeogenesis factor YvcK family protein [Candidatus Saccharimonadales bacterium]|nr:gluconeogenesis factor YvcK family protein [Candidatus Saccharimonadales bacterium]